MGSGSLRHTDVLVALVGTSVVMAQGSKRCFSLTLSAGDASRERSREELSAIELRNLGSPQ